MDISSIGNQAAPVSAPVESSQVRPPTEAQRNLIQAVKAINASEAFGQENEITFVIDRATRKAVVRIVNRETGEKIAEIPPESILQMAEEISGR